MTMIRRLSFLAALSVFLALPACSSQPSQAPIEPEPAPHKMGVGFGGPDCFGTLNPIAGVGDAGDNNRTYVVYDSTSQVAGTNPMRLTVAAFFDQAVTVLYQIKIGSDSTWRTMNGSGDAVTASTATFLDYLVKGSSNRIEVTTGNTGPTTTLIEVCRVFDRDKGT